MSRYDNVHGDEDELEFEWQTMKELETAAYYDMLLEENY